MKIIKIPLEIRPKIGLRREIKLKKTPLRQAKSLQISELKIERQEPYHTNKIGYVLCFVVTGWMEAHCAGVDYKLNEGEGIVFEPGEKHRINKGEGWMISISSIDYKSLRTNWEK